MSGCGVAWLNASDEWMAPLSGAVAIFATALIARSPARRSNPLQWLWPSMLLILAILTELDIGWFRSHAAEIMLAIPAGMYLLSALTYLLGSAGLCIRLERYARSLDDDSLLQMLPPDAASDARRWLAGDDSRVRELALVVHLATLMKALQTICPRKARHARCAM